MLLKVVNPSTEQVVAELEQASAKAVSDAVKRARTAQPKWAARPLAERISIFETFRQKVAEGVEDLAKVLSTDMGKALGQARGEVNGTLGRIDFFIEEVASTVETETVFEAGDGSMVEKISHDPLGVIANISAWNYPWFVGVNVFAPALLTGNAVVYKPSEYAAMTGLAIGRLLHESGVPKEVFPVLTGGADVGRALLEADIDGVFFTGSYATGRAINEAVASKLIKVQLELGGKDPVYVCEDVDVAAAAGGLADGAFYNTGQSCCSVERIYVHQKIYDAFVERFVETVKGFTIGDPFEEGTYIGPLTRSPQLDVLDAQVRDAKERGATVQCGGHRLERAGYFYAPTVVTGVDHTMDLMREETFGPVIGIMAVESDEQALELMNDTDYGLTSSVYTTDRARAEAMLEKLDSGSVYWNCCDRVSPRLPWSGRGQSGIGLTLSTYGITAFTQPKGWHLRR
jgi:acyl-CoA reductase-like NAD-dependent aldehyde dehydrogenase